jgi:hypothetical protein
MGIHSPVDCIGTAMKFDDATVSFYTFLASLDKGDRDEFGAMNNVAVLSGIVG